MMPSIHSLLAIAFAILPFLSLVHAQYPTELVGTWTTKSKKVLTGPGFYNPVSDRLIEPDLAGISYSFTSDGYYEEAYYRAIANPTTPHCPSSIMQWQHGTYSLPGNGSLILQPFGVDGRQLMSTPCSYDESVYTRYDQAELIEKYQAYTDPYHNVPRLDLYKFDGTPMQPMYLAYNPPQMLPTETLNPTPSATNAKRSVKETAKVKRGLDEGEDELAQKMLKDGSVGGKAGGRGKGRILMPSMDGINADKWWWAGVGFIAVGTVMYMMPTSGSK